MLEARVQMKLLIGCGPTGQLVFITPGMPTARDRQLSQDTGHLLVPDPAKSMDLSGFTVRVRVARRVASRLRGCRATGRATSQHSAQETSLCSCFLGILLTELCLGAEAPLLFCLGSLSKFVYLFEEHRPPLGTPLSLSSDPFLVVGRSKQV